jgi:hypothetical protein
MRDYLIWKILDFLNWLSPQKPFKKIYCADCKKMIVKPKKGGCYVGGFDGKKRCVNCHSEYEQPRPKGRGI